MSEFYYETGGLRWGRSHWISTNATYPFAKIYITTDYISITVNLILKQELLQFHRSEICSITTETRLLGRGIRIRHSKPSSPKYILFWTMTFKSLQGGLREFGWAIEP